MENQYFSIRFSRYCVDAAIFILYTFTFSAMLGKRRDIHTAVKLLIILAPKASKC